MSIFVNIKVCINDILMQKWLKVNTLLWISSSQQNNTENLIINYVLCQLCAVFIIMSILYVSIIIISHFLGIIRE